MEASSGEFKLSIPFTETRTEHVLQQQISKQFTVFAIRVSRQTTAEEWQVDRRFNDFLTLHKTLKDKFPMVVQVFAASFPKKKLLLKTLDPRTIEERRAFFETYLRALLELSPRPGDVNAFLRIDAHPAAGGKKKLSKEDTTGLGGKHNGAGGVVSASGAGGKPLGLDDFEVLETLGSGAFGKVLLVRLIGAEVVDDNDGFTNDNNNGFNDGLFAMKVLKKNEVIRRNQVEHTLTERAVMETISHPFIVPLRFSFQTKTRLFMVSEFCPGGELFYHLREARAFNERAVKFYCAEILMALEHLHACQIVYRDLKPENVLLDRAGHVRITDFGLSKTNVSYDQGAKTYCGTPEYLAPEMILVKREDLQSYGFAIDWWSLGTFCFELYVGHPPFQDRNVKIMTERILNERVRFPGTVPLPSLPFRDFIFALLTRDPSKRLGTEGRVRDHVFFEGTRWEEDVLTKRLEPPVVPRFDPLEATANFDPPSDDDESAESVAKLSQMPAPTASPSKSGLAPSSTTTTTTTSTKFQRFVPLPSNVLGGSVKPSPSPSTQQQQLAATAEDEEVEDELTAMFKSYAFERDSASHGTSLSSPPRGTNTAPTATDDDQPRQKPAENTITDFTAVWGE